MEDSMIETGLHYTVSPARYAKGVMAVRCTPNGSGWKTLVAVLCSNELNARYSQREQAYMMSPAKVRKLEKMVEEVRERRRRNQD